MWRSPGRCFRPSVAQHQSCLSFNVTSAINTRLFVFLSGFRYLSLVTCCVQPPSSRNAPTVQTLIFQHPRKCFETVPVSVVQWTALLNIGDIQTLACSLYAYLHPLFVHPHRSHHSLPLSPLSSLIRPSRPLFLLRLLFLILLHFNLFLLQGP